MFRCTRGRFASAVIDILCMSALIVRGMQRRGNVSEKEFSFRATLFCAEARVHLPRAGAAVIGHRQCDITRVFYLPTRSIQRPGLCQSKREMGKEHNNAPTSNAEQRIWTAAWSYMAVNRNSGVE